MMSGTWQRWKIRRNKRLSAGARSCVLGSGDRKFAYLLLLKEGDAPHPGLSDFYGQAM
jgi:hypothetical protein